MGRTSAKRFREKLKAVKKWVKAVRYLMPLRKWWPMFQLKLLGHQRYCGVSGNYERVEAFTEQALRIEAKWYERASQRRHKCAAGFGSSLGDIGTQA
ncbi:MAG TPA: hypothetical protein EYP63_03805 [Desulfotomaculum sp.]|nr:hypothetical protein [Desulfotomaculum sp.]